jgi:alkanesulfonate monooxygenase SsuD/methylene tetrahydromethanopterin reductase-like flavin-dependent oxidoreductase (luciferase family)
MAAVMLQWNHPILVAERMATLDIVSHGRAELCTARSR